MKITRIQITIKDLINGYKEKGPEGLEGIVAFGGKLDVRPPYQREYVYAPKERDEVIRTVKKNYPLNTMYWSKVDDDHYELMDGQQRTISICRYAAESERSFAVDEKYFFNLESDLQKKIEDYVLDIYVCDGTPSEVHEWFKVINIAGKPLTPQELRNTAYTGPWLSDAKIHFSKPTCAAYNMGKDYVTGSPIRQELLETAINWICDRDGLNSPEEYMAIHQHDENANQLWIYYKRVIEWVETIFVKKRKEMKGIEWGLLYNKHKDDELDPDEIEKKIAKLMMDDEIDNYKGIYLYIFDGLEKHLNLRTFSPAQRLRAYNNQHGLCPRCKAMNKPTKNKVWAIEEMEADHITPWHLGGKTDDSNCQMLCKTCNREKSGH